MAKIWKIRQPRIWLVPFLRGAERRTTRPAWLRYLVAILFVAAAAAARAGLLSPLGSHNVYVTFYPAVIFAALYGGFGSGLLATVLAAVAASYWLEPAGVPFIISNPANMLSTAVFLMSGALISWVCEVMLRVQLRASAAEAQVRLAEEHQRVAEALRESEETFRSLFDQAAVPTAVQGLDGFILRVNQAYSQFLGYSEEELRALTVMDITHPDDQDKARPLMHRLLAGELSSYHGEKRYCHKDGRVLWGDLTVSLVRDSRGQPLYFIVQVQDITERKRAENALLLTQFTMDHAADGVYWIASDAHFLAVNETACRMLGYTREELLALSVPEIDPDFPIEVWERNWKDLKTREIQNFETRHRTKDGRIIPVEITANHLEFGGQQYDCAFARDITERKRAENELRESRELLRAVVEGTSDAVYVKDAAGRYLLFNAAASRFSGKSAEEALGRDDTFLFPSEEAKALMAMDQAIMNGGVTVTVEEHVTDPAGKPLTFLSTKGPLFDEHGQLAGLFGIAREISHLKQTEDGLREANERLAEADRRKDEFLAMLAHELRNPLAPVRNAVQILNMVGPREPAQQRQRAIIDRQVTHMARLLDDLLDVSRITRGKIELKRQPLHLIDVLAHAVETATPLVEARRHALEVVPPPDDLCVEGDIDRLAQVVGNLLSNAAKYTEMGGRIRLSATREEGGAVVRVYDNGAGIAPEILPRVFDLFVQADRSLARAQGGLGIGLTMAKRLVEMHGGSLEAYSEGLGQGSEFVVRLPALPLAPSSLAPQPAPPQAAAQGAACRRVLVVDDVADSAASLAELLELWGHEVRTACDGSSALRIVREFHPNLILLDIGMPGMDGYEVALRLRAEHGRNGMVLVALTGYGQMQDHEATRAAGFDHHMVKPVDLEVLRELLTDCPPALPA